MRLYDVVLFVHLLGVITLFIAFGILQRAGAQARRAETMEQLRLWLRFLGTTSNMFPVAFILILAAGLYMTADVWTFTTPWILVALISVGIMFVTGTAVVGRSLSALAASIGDGEGPVTPEVRASVRQPRLWSTMSGLNAVALGVVWLMATKPGWLQSIAVVVILGIIGALIGGRIARPSSGD
jgi:hypothetical protein